MRLLSDTQVVEELRRIRGLVSDLFPPTLLPPGPILGSLDQLVEDMENRETVVVFRNEPNMPGMAVPGVGYRLRKGDAWTTNASSS